MRGPPLAQAGRTFATNMHEPCRHLQALPRRVYREIHRKDALLVDLLLVPMPRPEVGTIADSKIPFDTGALPPDMSAKLGRALLGEEPGAKRAKPRQQQAQQRYFGSGPPTA